MYSVFGLCHAQCVWSLLCTVCEVFVMHSVCGLCYVQCVVYVLQRVWSVSCVTCVVCGVCSVCGLIVPQEDLPFSDSGMCPDVVSDDIFSLIISCHCC